MRRCAAVCAALVLLLLWPVSPAPGSGSTSLRIGVLREVERVSIVFDHPVALTAGPLVSLSLEPGAYEFVPRAAGIEVAGAGTRFENTIRLSPTEGGRPIFAAYHSDSGGYTESSEVVWGGRYPYLQAVPDPYSTGAPNHEWIARLEVPAFEERLRRAGRSVRGITGIEVAETTRSGRVGLVRIPGTHGGLLIKGTDLRAILGAGLLRSTLFIVRLSPDEQPVVEFLGRGSGHGVGLSQWGARGMAGAGRTYQEILKYYYTGIEISRSH